MACGHPCFSINEVLIEHLRPPPKRNRGGRGKLMSGGGAHYSIPPNNLQMDSWLFILLLKLQAGQNYKQTDGQSDRHRDNVQHLVWPWFTEPLPDNEIVFYSPSYVVEIWSWLNSAEMSWKTFSYWLAVTHCLVSQETAIYWMKKKGD